MTDYTDEYEGLAVEAAALYFQREMLEDDQVVDVDELAGQLIALFDEGVDTLTWFDIYPIIKGCILK